MFVITTTLLALNAAPVLTISELVPTAPSDTSCIVMSANVDSRRSPLDSLSFTVDGATVKVCYGRPSARGRTMLGGTNVPYGKVWRTGANEPTMIHTTIPLVIGDVSVEPGTYSLYSVPGESQWQILVNASIDQWGHERNYTGAVAAQELGRATVVSERTEQHVETFTIRTESMDGGAALVLEWEHTRVRVPLRKAS